MFISIPELIEEFKNVTRIENHKILKLYANMYKTFIYVGVGLQKHDFIPLVIIDGIFTNDGYQTDNYTKFFESFSGSFIRVFGVDNYNPKDFKILVDELIINVNDYKSLS